MANKLKFIRLVVWVMFPLLMLEGSYNCITAQELASESARSAQVSSIRIGPHPVYTRILINLTESVPYQVTPDFINKQIKLTLPNTRKGPRVRSKSFNDKNLLQYSVRATERDLEVIFVLKSQNTRFFHSIDAQKQQIIIDIKSKSGPILKTRIGKSQNKSNTSPKSDPSLEGAPLRKKARLVGYSPKEIREIIAKSVSEKETGGWEEYQKALLEFQDTKYPSAVKLFREYYEKYPKSKYSEHALYLKAEAEYRITFKELNPIFDRALASYKLAIREFPKSKFYDHALLKVASIFDEIGYNLEARTLYNQGLKSKPKSLYNEVRKNSLAAMLMKEGELEKAFDAFQAILRKSPKNIEAKAGIFEIANKFFDKKDYPRALKIFEAGSRRWPGELNTKPEINYAMAEIYFSEKKYDKARKYFFNFLNLDPAAEKSHTALNRIGDSYIVEGQYQHALSVFDESAKRKSVKLDERGAPVFDDDGNKMREETAETQYGEIRMADIGVRSPRLKIQDIVFNVEPYYQPFKTFEKVYEEAINVDILAEVTLSKGIAYLLEQNYLKAIDEFKKLLPMGPESRFYQESDRYIRQALIALVDKYSNQNGNLPILYSYSDFISLPIGDINNAQTLLQIGEAYQSIGMFAEAVKFYEKVKVRDSQKTYRDRVFLNLGRIHLEKKNFDDAVLVGQKFLQIYPRSKWIPDAMKFLAQALRGRGEFENAIKIYEELLARPVDKAEVHYLMAENYSDMKRLTDAVQSYQKAISVYDRQERTVPVYLQNAYYHLGMSLYKLNRFGPAFEALKSARELFPDNSLRDWADYLIIESLEKLGDPLKVAEGLNRLVKVDNADGLTRKAAESRVKIQEWEKQLKDG